MRPAEDMAVLLIDVQREFVARMAGDAEAVLSRLERLCLLAAFLDLPLVATLERPVAKKGGLLPRLERVLPASARTVEKSTFDACGEPAVRDALAATGRRRFAVAGAETDVCVLLTTLGLRAAGYDVHLVEDACFSATDATGAAFHRMRAAGATPCTFKTLAYELTGVVEAAWPDAWRERSHLFPPPEEPA